MINGQLQVAQPAITSNGILDRVCVCVCCRESDSIFCRGMNILWSELIRRFASWDLRGEFVLFQIICVMNYTSLGFNNMKTTQLQLEGEGWRAIFTLHTSKSCLAHFTVHNAQLTSCLWRTLRIKINKNNDITKSGMTLFPTLFLHQMLLLHSFYFKIKLVLNFRHSQQIPDVSDVLLVLNSRGHISILLDLGDTLQVCLLFNVQQLSS